MKSKKEKFHDYDLTFEELLNAYQDCKRRKASSDSAIKFDMDLSLNLFRLWKDLLHSKYQIGKSNVFCIEYPVKREVFAADYRDRIIHHELMLNTMRCFEESFIEDSYSCRVGKGTLYGVKQCAKYIAEATNNYTEGKYIVKCDLKSFFMTINKTDLFNVIWKQMYDFYKDIYSQDKLDFLKWITNIIIMNVPQKNCILKQPYSMWEDLPKNKSLFFQDDNIGIPIGNLTSQIFANYFLNEFDHLVIQKVGEHRYGRYVDDFFVIFNSSEEAHEFLEWAREYLTSIGVTLHPNKLYIQPTSKGITFIGGVIKNGRLYISNRTKDKFYKVINDYIVLIQETQSQNRELTQSELNKVLSSVNSYLGLMKHFMTYKIRCKGIYKLLDAGYNKYFIYNKNRTKLIQLNKPKVQLREPVIMMKTEDLIQCQDL